MKKYLLLMITLFSFHAYAEIKTGPQIEKLYPVAFYHDATDGLYIEFQQGSMPGCSHEKEGDSVNLTLITRSFIHFYLR